MLAHGRYAWDRQLALWSRGNVKEDTKLFGEMRLLRIPLTDPAWNGLNIDVPVMHLGETTVLGVVGGDAGKPRISFVYGNKPFSDVVWFYQQHLVASISCTGVTITCPSLYLPVGDLPRIVNQRGEHARLVDAARSEFEGERMVGAIPAGNLPQDRCLDPKVFTLGCNPVAPLARDIAQAAQVGDDLPGGGHHRARRARTASASFASTGMVFSNERHGSVMLCPETSGRMR